MTAQAGRSGGSETSPRRCRFHILKHSDDDRLTWSEVKLLILPHAGTRAMDACLWIDPQGRLWVFWDQSAGLQDGRYGVWAIVTDEPDADEPQWSEAATLILPSSLGETNLLSCR